MARLMTRDGSVVGVRGFHLQKGLPIMSQFLGDLPHCLITNTAQL